MEVNLSVSGEIEEANFVKKTYNRTGDAIELWQYVIRQNDFGREQINIPFIAFNPRKKEWSRHLYVGSNVRVDLCVCGYKMKDKWYLQAKLMKVWVDSLVSEVPHHNRRKRNELDEVAIEVIRDKDGTSPRIEELKRREEEEFKNSIK